MKIRKAVAKAVFYGIQHLLNLIVLLLLMFIPFLSSFYITFYLLTNHNEIIKEHIVYDIVYKKGARYIM